MKLFLDSSVILAACNSSTGASRHVCEQGADRGWKLLSSPYVEAEISRNLAGRPARWKTYWDQLRPTLVPVEDILTVSLPVVFAASKDKPILFSAYAYADVLLTLDARDFAGVLGGDFTAWLCESPLTSSCNNDTRGESELSCRFPQSEATVADRVSSCVAT